jgi:two-component system sensor histidine kinase CiaH
MFKTLRNKLLILNMSIILVVMTAAFAVIYFITYSNIQTENQNKLKSIASLPRGVSLMQEGEHITATQSNKKVIGIVPSNFSVSFNILMDDSGEVLKIVSFIDMPEEIYLKAAKLAFGSKNDMGTISLEGKKWMYSATKLNGAFVINENGKQIVTQTAETNRQIAFLDVTDSGKILTGLLMTCLIIGIAMIFVIFAISLYFANKSIKPISETWNKQKQFIADASHELKTPLAIISANFDVLLSNEEESIVSQKKWIHYIQTEIGRMSKLVSDLLYLAKTEDGNIEMQNMPFDISEIVNDAILSTEAIVYEKGITLLHSIEPNIIANGDNEKIGQVVMILLDNSVKYTNSYGSINISLKKTRHNILFSIKNTGNGIPSKDLPKLFDRFYRADTARTQEDGGGYGLGLSIAKAIIDRQGGKLYVQSTENEETTFIFTLEF